MNIRSAYILDGYRIILELLHCLLSKRFDAVVTTGMPVLESIPAFIVSKFLKIPIIIKETHWYWPNTLMAKLVWPINRMMVFNCNLVVCPGKKAYKYWRALGVPQEKITIVPFYASVLNVTPEISDLAVGLRSNFNGKICILYFGRLIKKKGVDFLVKAFEQISKEFKNVTLIIAGEGPERNSLEQLCHHLQLSNVVFIGKVEENIKSAYFLAADMYVYPSITFELPEEWPLGVVEAMSVGKPIVITTAVGSGPDVVKQGVNGYIVREQDSDALYKAIKKMLEDKELIKIMGMASLNAIEKSFTFKHASESFSEAIETVLTKGPYYWKN